MERRFTIEPQGLPDLPGMMLATVEALKEIGGSATIQELDEKVAELEGVTEEEQSFAMPNNNRQPRFNYYLSWARTYLKRGGALENSARGVWALTEFGKRITEYDQTKKIHEQVNAEERERARRKRAEAKVKKDNGQDNGRIAPSSDEMSPDQ
ncbi:MAG TPA: restriction endonuclease, partial [Aliiroseovarius sp.]|nr:restriction endonuclease [Aliiroseovarius sp.]